VAYEKSCVATLRMLNVAEGTYWGGDTAKGYARTLRELGPAGSGMIDAVTASGEKGGYRFRLVSERTGTNRPIKHYAITARPVKRLAKDQRSFVTDETGIIRFTKENREATISDPPLDSPSQRQ
jgi:hypothetical protein